MAAAGNLNQPAADEDDGGSCASGIALLTVANCAALLAKPVARNAGKQEPPANYAGDHFTHRIARRTRKSPLYRRTRDEKRRRNLGRERVRQGRLEDRPCAFFANSRLILPRDDRIRQGGRVHAESRGKGYRFVKVGIIEA